MSVLVVADEPTTKVLQELGRCRDPTSAFIKVHLSDAGHDVGGDDPVDDQRGLQLVAEDAIPSSTPHMAVGGRR